MVEYTWYSIVFILARDFCVLVLTRGFLYLWRKSFPSESQLAPMPNWWWKSRPKVNGLLRFLLTMKFSLILCVPIPMLNAKVPIGLMLLPLTEESLMPAEGCTLSVQCFFCRHFSLITDFEAPVSQSTDIFLLWIVTGKSAVILSSICICLISWGGFLHSEKSKCSKDKSTSLELVSIVSFSASSCNFSSISFTVSTCEGFLYVSGLEVSFENLMHLDWLLNFVFSGWLPVACVDFT